MRSKLIQTIAVILLAHLLLMVGVVHASSGIDYNKEFGPFSGKVSEVKIERGR